MFEVRIENVINVLVDEYLRKIDRNAKIDYNKKTIEENGICIQIRFGANCFERDKRITENYYILFCGNVSVYYSPCKNKKNEFASSPEDVPPENWINTSNHDSCWRSDGLNFITKRYFDICKKISPDIAPKNVDTYSSFGWITNVRIRHKKTEDYFKKIIKIEELKNV